MSDTSKVEGSFRVALQSISIERQDRQPEDDFKTWGQVVVLTRGRPSARFWYAGADSDANLGKTSVTPGNEAAAYNFVRSSKPFPLDVATLSDLCSSQVQVRCRERRKAPPKAKRLFSRPHKPAIPTISST